MKHIPIIAALALAVVLAGCGRGLTQQEILKAKVLCESGGMEPLYLTQLGSSEIVEAQCKPKGM